MVLPHKEFTSAGKASGLQIWRIEQLELVPVNEGSHGNFYVGDAYVILSTVQQRDNFFYHLHYWLGKECSQDESAAAAIFTVQLDDYLGGKPVQYRELQGVESTAFTRYFKGGITYKTGGVASGFHHVVTNDLSAQRLLHIKGRRVVRATQVPLSWDSFNTGDCFIVDLGNVIYQWCGSKCNHFERLKATQVARGIRDNERNGRAELVVVEEGGEPSKLTDVLGVKPDLTEGDDDDDTKADMSNRKMAKLYMVSDASGSMKVTVVREDNPFNQSDLLSDECFILDHGKNKMIFVWKGHNANPSERKEAMKTAEGFIKQMGYPANTKIQVLPEGGETPMFKQFFLGWKDRDQSEGFGRVFVTERIARIEQVAFDASKLHESHHMAAQYNMVDDGSGDTQIWRVESSGRVPVDTRSHGQFYGGDCYIILYTYGKRQIIYTWQGASCSLDELTASAFLTVELDRSLGGNAVQVRVCQGKEPPHLLSLFKTKPLIVYKNGTSRLGGQAPPPPTRLFQVRKNLATITRIAEVDAKATGLNSNDAFLLKMADGRGYLWKGKGASEEETGGVASGFHHVVTNDLSAQRLLHIKGRRVVRATQVPLSWDSFNTGDCFIVDLGNVIYQWCGSKCNHFERLKATQVARGIRDNERNGRAELVVVEEGGEPSKLTDVLGVKPDLTEGDDDDDTKADMSNRKMAKLYMVSDASGSMKVTVVREDNPFNQSDLLSDECFILDHGKNKMIFVWKGHNANPSERKEAMKTAEGFIKQMGYPANTKIQVLPEGGETPMFKQFFLGWKDRDQSEGFGRVFVTERIARIEQVAFDASKLHESHHMAAQYNMVDDGSGDTQIWRVESSGRVPVDTRSHGQFYGGDCYIILYTYGKRQIIYTWQGASCSLDELTASAFLTVELDRSLGGNAVQVRVCQGKEPPHLLSLFKTKPLIVYKNGTSRLGGQAPPPPTRLFQVRKNLATITRIAEVDAKATGLNSNDAFLLKMADGRGYLWKGKGASEEEVKGAEYMCRELKCGSDGIMEGSEPAGFWAALGGKTEYQTSERLESQTMTHPPRLFGCSNKTGRFTVEEVPGEFTQDDLAEDDVMLMDVWDQVFVWIGKDANEVERTESVKSAKQYIETDPSGRDKFTPVVVVKQGHEPPTFTGWFLAWDPSHWDSVAWSMKSMTLKC